MSEQKTIEIDVLVNFKEYVRLRYIKAFKYLWLFVPPIIFYLISFPWKLIPNIFSYGNFINILPVILLTLVFFGLCVFVFFAPYLSARKYMQTLKVLNEEVHYKFSRDGIRAVGNNWDSNNDWSLILKAEEVGGFILLYLTHSMSAYPLPLRCFESETQITEFRDLVRSQLGAKAKLKSPSQRLGLK